jgi:hypothetical protein
MTRVGTQVDDEQLREDMRAFADEMNDELVVKRVSVSETADAEEHTEVTLEFTIVPSTASTFDQYTIPYND